MTAQIETAIIEQSPTGRQKLVAWLRAFEEAMDYDPREYTDASIKYLRNEVKQLKARLDKAEAATKASPDAATFPNSTRRQI